jgi:hypothetical protein
MTVQRIDLKTVEPAADKAIRLVIRPEPLSGTQCRHAPPLV